MPSLKSLILSAACAAGLAAPALAHDVWLIPQSRDDGTVVQVMFGDPTHLQLLDYRRIVSLDLITPAGKTSLKGRLAQGLPERNPSLQTAPFKAAGPAIVAVNFDYGFWAVDPADKSESNVSKIHFPGSPESWWVPKYGKTLLGPGSHQLRSGALLELVPLSDPFAGGDTVRIRLEYKGKPLANQKITYGDGVALIKEADMPTLTTDKDGVIQLDIKRKGWHVLTSDVLADPSYPALADKDELYATLAFNLGK